MFNFCLDFLSIFLDFEFYQPIIFCFISVCVVSLFFKILLR